jgi:hypothetical protein
MLHFEEESQSLQLRDQIREYMDRGDALEHINYLDFFLNTYDAPLVTNDMDNSLRWKSHIRVPYRASSGRSKYCRVLRHEKHETIPYFPGPWLPRRNEKQTYPLYCASMLALFQPWRSLADLKPAHLTFEIAFDTFAATASVEVLKIIDNIQYFYDCSDQARERRVNRSFDSAWKTSSAETTHDDDEDDEENIDDVSDETLTDDESCTQLITESDIENALQDCHSTRELLYADVAINIAEDFGIFNDDAVQVATCPPSSLATERDMQLSLQWEELIEHGQGSNLKPMEKEKPSVDIGSVSATSLTRLPENEIGFVQRSTDTCTSKSVPALQNITADLNREQLIAYTIIRNSLLAHLADQPYEQLLMLITGEGGTGKSKLLDAVTDLFAAHNCESQLARTAMSGVAACIIKGSTLHSWAGLPPRQMPRTDKWATHPRPEMARRRHDNMDLKFMLAVDEGSMLTTEQLTLLSQASLSFELQFVLDDLTI